MLRLMPMSRLILLDETEVISGGTAVARERLAREDLLKASHEFRCKYKIEMTADDIARRIMLVVTSFDFHRLAHPDLNKLPDEFERMIYDEAKAALTDFKGLIKENTTRGLTTREIRDNAEKISGKRRSERGQPQIYDMDTIHKFVEQIEDLAGKSFRYKRILNSNIAPPIGEMLDLLLAAVNWSWRASELGSHRTPANRVAKAEGIIAKLRQDRSDETD